MLCVGVKGRKCQHLWRPRLGTLPGTRGPAWSCHLGIYHLIDEGHADGSRRDGTLAALGVLCMDDVI